MVYSDCFEFLTCFNETFYYFFFLIRKNLGSVLYYSNIRGSHFAEEEKNGGIAYCIIACLCLSFPNFICVMCIFLLVPLVDFCSGIQFYLLLSPYLCFISLLYLDLYVLGDDALIS